MLQVTRCEGFYCCCYCSLWCSCSYYFYYDHHHSYSNHSLVTKLENCFEKSAFYFKIQRKLAGYKCWLQMFRAWMANVRYKICGHSLSIHTLHNRFCDLLDRPTPPPTHIHTTSLRTILKCIKKKCSTSWSYYVKTAAYKPYQQCKTTGIFHLHNFPKK